MRRLLARLLVVVALGTPALGQTATQPASEPATTRPATAPARPTTRATTRPAFDPKKAAEDAAARAALDALAGETDTTTELDALNNKYLASDITTVVDQNLTGLTDDVRLRLDENQRLLRANPSLELLRQQESALSEELRQLAEWDSDLDRRKATLQDGVTRLTHAMNLWDGRKKDLSARRDVLVSFGSDTSKLRSVEERVTAVQTEIGYLLAKYDTELSRAGNLQLTISSTRNALREALSAVAEAQRKARDRLLVQDSPPLWESLLHPMAQGDVTEQGRNSLTNQWRATVNYLPRQQKAFLFHLGGVAALAAMLIWLRRRTRQWVGSDPNLLAATRVFQTPIATAITASMILTPWIYAGAPRLFWGLLGTAALLPTIMVLRPLIERSLRPLLYGLAVAIFVNLLLSVVAALPLLYRALQLGQMGGSTVFFLWFLRTGRGVEGDPKRPPLRKAAVIGARFGLAITIVASLANVFGYLSLSRLIGNALLTSAYLGVLLDTSVHVIDALLLGLSHVRPLNALGMVQRHRPLLLKRLHLLIVVLAVGLWAFFTLESLSIRQPVVDVARAIWYFPNAPDDTRRAVVVNPLAAVDGSAPTANPAAPITGSGTAATPSAAEDVPAVRKDESPNKETLLYVGGAVLFVLSIVASIYAARFVNFLLEEDIYPRLQLARGMPYAISTLLRYVILAVGFSLAIVNLGYGDPTKLTILVSAFSIGLGFGLQNIVNNFVSGLILLFERPVQVGDVIELDNVTGVVSRIGIRASVIRTPLAAEIIIPNGRLISDRVVNWTLSNRQRGVELSLVIAPGVEPQKVIALLCSTARSLPLVASYPAPQAAFTEFSGGGMKFEVRAWTNRFEDWTNVRSELAVAINAMLVKENIALKG